MIILLGGSGYIGQAFAKELGKRRWDFVNIARSQTDYSDFSTLLELLRTRKPEFVINAAGYTGKPNVDACEVARADTLQGNTLLPATIAHACAAAGVPWGHVSSGCIYAGAKLKVGGSVTVEKDLTAPSLRSLFLKSPDAFSGFTEDDPPNFSFRQPPCSFYSGTKALGEEAVAGVGRSYVWRLRIPFDEWDSPRNYLSKIQRYSKVYDNVNSISHREDYVKACLDLWALKAPFGIYNVTNPGAVTTAQVLDRLKAGLKLNREFSFWASDEEFYATAAKTPRSNCIMATDKLLAAGVKIRSVLEALDDSIARWTPEKIR